MSVSLGVPDGVTTRPIPCVSEKYVAGSDGHIYCFSEARVNARKPRPFQMAEAIGDAGYPFVAIIDQGRKRSKAVHVLICSAFHGVRPSATHEVRHLDGTRDNSLPGNLLWGTPAENEADKRRHGTVAEGSRHGAAKLTDEAVRILRAAIPTGLWNATDAAKVFGVDPSVIRAAVSGKNWKSIS